jgi:GLPGLI family protein
MQGLPERFVLKKIMKIQHKDLIPVLVFLILGPDLQAQVKEGRVIYERKMNMRRHMEDESMKNLVPEFSVSKSELLFHGDESLFRNIKEEEDIRDQAGQQEGMMVRINMGGNDDETYQNYSTVMHVETKELGPKKYLIQDSVRKFDWKLESDTQTVCGYLCHKATCKSAQGKAIVAWYADNILSPGGPEVFGGLPGLILLLNVDDGDLVMTAVEIQTSHFDGSLVKAPTTGKKISRAEFTKMMEEQFGPSDGKTHIRIIRQ